MFKIAVNNLVKSIGEDVYQPTPSVASSKNLQPLSLVEREGSILPFRSLTDYYTTEFSLEDILLNAELKAEIKEDDMLGTFNRESTVKISGELKGHVKGIFDAEVSNVDELTIHSKLGELCVQEVDLPALLDSIHNCKLNMEHELVKEMACGKRKALCVVTGVVKTTSPSTITAVVDQSINASTEASHPTLMGGAGAVGGKIKGLYEKSSNRDISFPAHTVLAYQLVELAVNDSGDLRMLVMHGARGGFHENKLVKSTKRKPLKSVS